MTLTIQDYEEFVLGCALRWPQDDTIAVNLHNLPSFRFEPGTERRLVADKLHDLSDKSQPTDIMTVSSQLLDKIPGGVEYLRILSQKPFQFGSASPPSNFDYYCNIIKAAGIFRDLQAIGEDINEKMSDINKVALQYSDNPEVVLSDILEKMARLTNDQTKENDYQPLSTALQKAVQHTQDVIAGRKEGFLNIGWPSFEKYSIPRPSTYMGISGLSSIGKTQLGLLMIWARALYMWLHGIEGVCLINEFEQTDVSMATRMICAVAGIDSSNIRENGMTDEQMRKFEAVAYQMEKLPIEFSVKTGLTKTQIGNMILRTNMRTPVSMAFVDYPELMRGEKEDTEEQRVAGIARYFQELAQKTTANLIGIYQYPKFNNTSMIANYGAHRGSAAIYQALDIDLHIYNIPAMIYNNIKADYPPEYDQSMAHIFLSKNRDRKTGKFPFGWKGGYVQFYDPLNIQNKSGPLSNQDYGFMFEEEIKVIEDF